MATYIIKGKTAALDITIITDDDGNIKMMQGYGDTRDTVWITKEQREEIEQLFTPTQWNFNVVGNNPTVPDQTIKGLHYLRKPKSLAQQINDKTIVDFAEFVRRYLYVSKN